jgi:hypothetical protein
MNMEMNKNCKKNKELSKKLIQIWAHGKRKRSKAEEMVVKKRSSV